MGVSKKFIIGAVELAVAVVLIYATIRIFSRSETVIDVVSTEQQKTGQGIAEYNVTRYDGYKIEGSTVISYVKTVIQDYEIPVEITTSINTFTCIDNHKKLTKIIKKEGT